MKSEATLAELLGRMRTLEADHMPDDWPAVKMEDITALCDAVVAANTRVTNLEQIDGQRITEIMAQEGRANLYRETTGSFISTVLTIKRTNEPEWMEYLAERINEVCEVIGEEDRVAYNSRREVIYVTSKR